MNEQQPLQYLIPRRIDQGYQIFPGWGLLQVATVAVAALAGGLIGLMGWLISHHFAILAVLLILGGGIGFTAARPLPDGTTLLDRFAAMRDWSRRQKLYLFDWSRDDW